jgi:hypothetical protein
MGRWVWGAISLLFINTSFGASPPAGYLEKSAEAKRAWHAEQALATQYRPNKWGAACVQSIALAGALPKAILSRTTSTGSGYADDWWRRTFGKMIHSVGVTAPGEIELTQNLLGLFPGRHPITYRFSLANPFVPYLPGGEFRPGLLVIVHVDGAEDRNLFLMPRAGLRGYREERNPFELIYTHRLDRPGWFLSTVAALTFGRVSSDPFTQFVDGSLGQNYREGEGNLPSRQVSPHIEFYGQSAWRAEYDAAPGKHFWDRFSAMVVRPDSAPMFEIAWVEDGMPVVVGNARITGKWRSSLHGDGWFAQHKGFILR